MVEELIELHMGKDKASGAELVMGEARFTELTTVHVTLNAGTLLLRGERVFLDVGTRARIPDVPGLAAAAPMGFTAFGAEASELMAVVQTEMLCGVPYTALRNAIFAHPTAAEGLDGRFANALTAPAPN
jgi:pyruvate/2-oxoglutarate dehydrogenase complex dihydrolipoamide dehydrogenase (E3) component